MNEYVHCWQNGEPCTYPTGKLVCVGRNYVEHAKELNNPIPKSPLLFIKPATSAVPLAPCFNFSEAFGTCHFETEIALLVGRQIQGPQQDLSSIVGVGLALDMTRRELQSKLKEKGHPWEIAKGFDGSCPLSTFVRVDEIADLDQLQLHLSIDGKLRQHGGVSDMIFGLLELLNVVTRHFSLQPGDVLLTGTPAGVGALRHQLPMQMELLHGTEVLLKLETQALLQETLV